MGTTDEGLFLQLALRFVFKTKTWFKKRDHLEAVLDAIAQLPFFRDLTHAGKDGSLQPFNGLAAAKSLVATGKNDITALQDSANDSADLMVYISPVDEVLMMKIWAGRAALARHRATIIDQLATAATQIRAALRPSAGLADAAAAPFHMNGRPFDYPRPRPPRIDPVNTLTPVIDFIDLEFHKSSNDEADHERAQKLSRAKPGPPAQRTETDGLVVIRWAAKASDEEMRRACTARDRWFSETGLGQLKPGFNEQGDLREGATAKPLPPLTLYSAKTRIGYKAVVVFPDGNIEQHHWNQAKMILKDKKLPDGSPVDTVKIIVPTRELVWSIQDEAKAAGFGGVLYSADKGIWDPDPPGTWLEPPIGKGSATTPKTPKRPVKGKGASK